MNYNIAGKVGVVKKQTFLYVFFMGASDLKMIILVT